MSTDDMTKNFRVSYYQKVGFKNVTGDKLLQEILKEDIIDMKQLLYFCQHSATPAMYRRHVWQLLLGILPPQTHTHDYILHQEKETFEILDRGLSTLEASSDDVEVKDEADRCLKLHLLKNNLLGFHFNDEDWHEFFRLTASVCNELFEFSSTVYRMSNKLFDYFTEQNYEKLTVQYTATIRKRLENENLDLFSHCAKLGAFEAVPFRRWFKHSFAGIIHNNGSIEFIWDFLLAAKPVILVCVSVAIFLINKTALVNVNRKEEIVRILNEVPYTEEKSKFIVKKAVELWKKYEKNSS